MEYLTPPHGGEINDLQVDEARAYQLKAGFGDCLSITLKLGLHRETTLQSVKNPWANDTGICRFLYLFTYEVYDSLGADKSPLTEVISHAANST